MMTYQNSPFKGKTVVKKKGNKVRIIYKRWKVGLPITHEEECILKKYYPFLR